MRQEKYHYAREVLIERSLRKIPVLLPFITLLTASILVSGIWFCMELFRQGHYWSVIPSALFIHSFFIVLIHDAAHQSITRTDLDRVILNLGSGLMLLPFYGEGFRKFHLMHHAHTNEEHDPLWSPLKQKLFEKNRALYFLFELVPLLFTFYNVFTTSKQQKKNADRIIIDSLRINPLYMAASALLSIIVFTWIFPPVLFVLGSLFFVNLLSTVRHWSEHIGSNSEKESNTYWFPLGMGIGNHEAHHRYSHLSWFTLMIGLFYRKKDTNPLKVVRGVLWDKNYKHYKA